MSSVEDLLKLSSERKEEVRNVLRVWKEESDEWKMFSQIQSYLEWHPQKLTRWLRRLVNEGILLRKEEGRHVYYRPNPGKLGPFMGILRLMWLERLLREGLKEGADNVFSYGEPSCPGLGGHPVKGHYLHFYPNPLWEYNSSLEIFGFPEEENLLPIERAILNHITRELLRYFRWLAWLRAKYLARKLLNIQLPLEEDFRHVLTETAIREWITGGEEKALHEAKRMFKLGPDKLMRKGRKMGILGKNLKLPKPSSTKENLWSIMLKLRNRGYANNLALIISSGPKRTSLTKKGPCLNTDEENTPPLPPLKLPRELTYKKLEGDLLIRISDTSQPLRFSAYNPLPFPVKPRILVQGYKYKLEPITDETTLKKLKKGKLPIRKFTVLELEEIQRVEA